MGKLPMQTVSVGMHVKIMLKSLQRVFAAEQHIQINSIVRFVVMPTTHGMKRHKAVCKRKGRFCRGYLTRHSSGWDTDAGDFIAWGYLSPVFRVDETRISVILSLGITLTRCFEWMRHRCGCWVIPTRRPTVDVKLRPLKHLHSILFAQLFLWTLPPVCLVPVLLFHALFSSNLLYVCFDVQILRCAA